MIVRRAELKALGFRKIEQYYSYIIESRTNGQHAQAKELFAELSDEMQGQKVEFFRWLQEMGAEPEEWQNYLKCYLAF
jgi:hypothetical protein